jgi:adenylate kinase family enzyme
MAAWTGPSVRIECRILALCIDRAQWSADARAHVHQPEFGLRRPAAPRCTTSSRGLHSRVVLPQRIHILGASGSGTTTLAACIAARYGHRHLDTDDYYWLPTQPPFRATRPPDERLAILRQALRGNLRWVLSGSLCGWGDCFIPEFELVVFLAIPDSIRMARLRAREIQRYGPRAIAPGGELHEAHLHFLDWARRYETGDLIIRSRALHEAWLADLPCKVIRLEGDLSTDERLARIETVA